MGAIGLAVVAVADAFGYGPGALSGDLDKTGIGSDLVESRKGSLRLGEQVAIEVGFELEKGIVDAEAVIFHAALKEHDQFLLAGQTFEDLEELGGGGVERVVESGFVGFGALLPTERLFAEVGDFAVDVEVLILEVIHLRGEFEHFGAQGCSDFEGGLAGIVVELADSKVALSESWTTVTSMNSGVLDLNMRRNVSFAAAAGVAAVLA